MFNKILSKKFIGWLIVTLFVVMSIVKNFNIDNTLINWWGWITVSWISGQSIIDVIKELKK